jgi:hypothetical protein
MMGDDMYWAERWDIGAFIFDLVGFFFVRGREGQCALVCF